tara:strand:- start:45 stop:569 length:525 start_codon:yes stop_codon:yes gene_type:complete
MAEIPKEGFDPFNAPIPGQSLTDEPGKWPWEQPAKYTDLKETLDVTMDRLFKPKFLERVITMLKAGIPVEGIARTIVFAGFAEGQYTVDVATMITKPVFEAVLTIGLIAEVENMQITIDTEQQKKETKFFTDMSHLQVVRELADEAIEDLEKSPKPEKQTGIMARPEEVEEIEE